MTINSQIFCFNTAVILKKIKNWTLFSVFCIKSVFLQKFNFFDFYKIKSTYSELSRQKLSIGTNIVYKFSILFLGHFKGPKNQKKNNLRSIAKNGYQSKALDEIIPNMCFLFYKNQKNIEFL